MLVAGHVEEFLLALGADFEPVAAALKLAAERAHKFAFLVENENGRMILLVGAALVNHVEQAALSTATLWVVCQAILARELGPVVLHLVFVLALADDGFPAGFGSGEDMRERQGGGGEAVFRRKLGGRRMGFMIVTRVRVFQTLENRTVVIPLTPPGGQASKGLDLRPACPGCGQAA